MNKDRPKISSGPSNLVKSIFVYLVIKPAAAKISAGAISERKMPFISI